MQVKGSYKLSEDFKKGPTKPKKVAKKSAAATPKKVCSPSITLLKPLTCALKAVEYILLCLIGKPYACR